MLDFHIKSDVCDELWRFALEEVDTKESVSKASIETKAKWFDAIFNKMIKIWDEEEKIRMARYYINNKQTYNVNVK